MDRAAQMLHPADRSRYSRKRESLHLFGPVVGEAIFETVAGMLIARGAGPELPVRGAFVAQHFISDDGVDFLRLLFLRALLFDSLLFLCGWLVAHGSWMSKERSTRVELGIWTPLCTSTR